MIVVAVEHFDVDAGFGHPSGELAELARNRLLEPLNDNVTLGDHPNTGLLECRARSASVGKKEMRDPAPIDDPRSSTLDTDAGTTKCFPHFRERTRPIVELNR